MTYTLIGVNVFIYLLQIVPGLNITNLLVYAPYLSFGEFAAQGAPYEPWRMVTSTFAHSPTSVLHILFNMYTLWMFGQVLETMLGRGRFLTLYLLSGLAGSLGVMYFDYALGLDMTTGVVGASGAIFGLMGAYLIILRHLGSSSLGLLILVGINLVIGFLPGMNWAWQAHVGGLIGGLVLGLIFARTRTPDRARLQVWLVVAVAIIEVFAALAQAPFIVG